MGEPGVDMRVVLEEFRWIGSVHRSCSPKRPWSGEELKSRHDGGNEEQESSEILCSPITRGASPPFKTRRKLLPGSSNSDDSPQQRIGACCELVFEEAAIDKVVQTIQGPNMVDRARAKLQAALASKGKEFRKRKVTHSRNKVKSGRLVKSAGRPTNSSSTGTIGLPHADCDHVDMSFPRTNVGDPIVEQGQLTRPAAAMARRNRSRESEDSANNVTNKERPKEGLVEGTSQLSHDDGDVVSLEGDVNAPVLAKRGQQDKPALGRRRVTVDSARRKLESVEASETRSDFVKECAGTFVSSVHSAGEEQKARQATSSQQGEALANNNCKMLAGSVAIGSKVRTRASVTRAKVNREAPVVTTQQSRKKGSKKRKGEPKPPEPATSMPFVDIEEDIEGNAYPGLISFSSDEETWVVTRNYRRKRQRAVKGQYDVVQGLGQAELTSGHEFDVLRHSSNMLADTNVTSASCGEVRPRSSVGVPKAKLEEAIANQQSKKHGRKLRTNGRKPKAAVPLVHSVEDGEENDYRGHAYFSSDEEIWVSSRNYRQKWRKSMKKRWAEDVDPKAHPVVDVSKGGGEGGADGENENSIDEELSEARTCGQQGNSPDTVWVPPVSSYGLIQEQLYRDPWKLLVSCMLLNQTSGRQMHKVIWTLFELCPTPEKTVATETAQIAEVIHSLGLQNKRAKMIQRFSAEYAQGNWENVMELHGIGKYAADAHAIFCEGRWRDLTPEDHMLCNYWNWLWETDGQGCAFTPD